VFCDRLHAIGRPCSFQAGHPNRSRIIGPGKGVRISSSRGTHNLGPATIDLWAILMPEGDAVTSRRTAKRPPPNQVM